MTDQELMQKALDALESVFEGDDKGAEYWTVTGGTYEAVECMQVMRALRARLAQPEPEPEKNQDKPCVEDDGCPTEKAVLQRFWREHQAQPEQEPVTTLFGSLPVYNVVTQPEPVAWSHNYISDNVITHRPADIDRYPDRWTALYKDPTPCQICESLARTVMMDQTSHDTAPPQREWQGLTDEEYEAMAENHVTNCYFDTLTYARAIEAKLKEKNNG